MTDPNDKLLYDPRLYHNLPPEDRPSQFISDYKDIQINVKDLDSFAKSLQTELEQNYLPHRDKVAEELSVGDVYTNESFTEFIEALQRHTEIRQVTLNRLFDHGTGTGTLSEAATIISSNYGAADAYSAATAKSVDNVMTQGPTTTETPVNTNTQVRTDPQVYVPGTDTTVTVPQDTSNTQSGSQDDGTSVTG
ncbi:MAG: hypothetical protein HOU81_15770 [Hamadaea sp.]|uniref:hypothetical protein n=1 Tax=Hamadaea sp. TaxID=2024425 RepID=UPI00182027F6|nr:hypothetical protein [Hamadaea sp.]NUR72271.1 hypothetical protein [Hamadaea sp.]NUT23227.1 hypothetical protein [Hamadaea sp.]